MSQTAVRGLRFNTSEAQLYADGWRNENRVCEYTGRCVSCKRRTYAFTDGENDPRGPLGDHAAMPFCAEDYSMVGPDVPCCFLCQNNDEATYRRALRVAESRWTEKEV